MAIYDVTKVTANGRRNSDEMYLRPLKINENKIDKIDNVISVNMLTHCSHKETLTPIH